MQFKYISPKPFYINFLFYKKIDIKKNITFFLNKNDIY